jgi:hypothetical protein
VKVSAAQSSKESVEKVVERLFQMSTRKRQVAQACSAGGLFLSLAFVPVGYFAGVAPLVPAMREVISGEQQIGSSGGSLEPPGPLS